MCLFLHVVALMLISFVNIQNKKQKKVSQYAKIQILTNLTISLFDVCNKHLWKIFQENFQSSFSESHLFPKSQHMLILFSLTFTWESLTVSLHKRIIPQKNLFKSAFWVLAVLIQVDYLPLICYMLLCFTLEFPIGCGYLQQNLKI